MKTIWVIPNDDAEVALRRDMQGQVYPVLVEFYRAGRKAGVDCPHAQGWLTLEAARRFCTALRELLKEVDNE